MATTTMTTATRTTTTTTTVGSPHTVIEEAFKNFEKLIRPGDDRMFKQTSLKDVEEAARIISRDQSQRKCLRNLNRIKPLFGILHKLSAPMETLCQGTPYLCYIWAPIKLILQIADEYDNSFEKLIDAYEQISCHLPRLDRLSHTFSNEADFQSVFADIYSDILDFHSHAYKFFRRGGWKTLFDASWRSFSGRFNAILRRLERGRDLLDKEAASFDILESKAFRQRVLEDLEKRESEKQEWQMRDVLLWLDLKGQDREQEELIQRRTSDREPTTCTWILNNSKVSTWLCDEESHPFLWLSGKPGSGKTTLATYLIEEAVFPPESMVLFCLCSYGFGQSENNAHSLALRSMIRQIVKSRNDLLPHVYDNYVKIGAVNSLPKTQLLLMELLHAVELTYLIIDGIDECRPDHQKHILTELFRFSSQNEDTGRTKVLVCSRETPEIVRRLRKVPTLSLNEVKEYVQRDIRVFTMTSLADLDDQFDQAIVSDICDQIVRKANGMFLWVQLVVTSLLDQASQEDLQRTINQLPNDLYGVYRSILDNIMIRSNKHQQDRVRFILGLLAVSCRPLKAWEVCDFITFHEGATTLDERNKLTKFALNACKPFVEELHSETMHIVHFSAREFFFENESGPLVKEIHVQYDITAACIKYLLTCDAFLGSEVDRSALACIVKGFHDLFPYVYEFWTTHLVKAFPTGLGQLVGESGARDPTLLFDRLAVFMRPHDILDPDGSLCFEDLDFLPHMGHKNSDVPLIIGQYIAYRRMLTDKQSQMSTDSVGGSDCGLNDPSVLSNVYRSFTTAFEGLLQQQGVLEVDSSVQQAQIDDFRFRHHDSAYLCRWTGCIWASMGFKSLIDRENHEERHRKSFRCPYPECDEACGGFMSKRSLRKHHEQHHTTLANLQLPPFPTSDTPKGDQSRATIEQKEIVGREFIYDEQEIENPPVRKRHSGARTIANSRMILDEDSTLTRHTEVSNRYRSGENSSTTEQSPSANVSGVVIECVCSFTHDDGNMVCCSRCITWQHVHCFYSGSELPADHICLKCLKGDAVLPTSIGPVQGAREKLSNGEEVSQDGVQVDANHAHIMSMIDQAHPLREWWPDSVPLSRIVFSQFHLAKRTAKSVKPPILDSESQDSVLYDIEVTPLERIAWVTLLTVEFHESMDSVDKSNMWSTKWSTISGLLMSAEDKVRTNSITREMYFTALALDLACIQAGYASSRTLKHFCKSSDVSKWSYGAFLMHYYRRSYPDQALITAKASQLEQSATQNQINSIFQTRNARYSFEGAQKHFFQMLAMTKFWQEYLDIGQESQSLLAESR